MRREIDHRQLAARSQHPCRLGDGAGRLVGEVKHLMDGDGVERGPRPRQLIHVAQTHLAVGQAGGVQVGTGHRQHFAREIDAHRAPDARTEQLEHAAGAGADIEQIPDAVVRKEIDQRPLDLFLVHIERADVIPIGSVCAEIGRRRIGARPFDLRQAFEIELERLVVAWDEIHQRLRQPGWTALLHQTVEHPSPLAKPVENPGPAQ